MDSISISPAVVQDIPVILDLLYKLGRPKPSEDSDIVSFRNIVNNYISNSDKMIFVVKLNDVELVGMVSVVFLPRLNHSTLEMYITELIVH